MYMYKIVMRWYAFKYTQKLVPISLILRSMRGLFVLIVLGDYSHSYVGTSVMHLLPQRVCFWAVLAGKRV